MKERPILFSTPMVQAILAGRKTQTRRVVKPQPDEDGLAKFIPSQRWEDTGGKAYTCPYGKVGDVLWVRETWKEAPEQATWKKYSYKADYNSHLAQLGKWKPSIFMPKDASRIWLKITNVSVERLQDITNKDAMSEGIESIDHGVHWRNYVPSEISCFIHPMHSFESLWTSINGEDSWNANPWVWVIEFERIEKPTSDVQ